MPIATKMYKQKQSSSANAEEDFLISHSLPESLWLRCLISQGPLRCNAPYLSQNQIKSGIEDKICKEILEKCRIM